MVISGMRKLLEVQDSPRVSTSSSWLLSSTILQECTAWHRRSRYSLKQYFIDNPFGAKDIYIWEPIFAMLAANHVQLIVPARGGDTGHHRTL